MSGHVTSPVGFLARYRWLLFSFIPLGRIENDPSRIWGNDSPSRILGWSKHLAPSLVIML